MYALVEIKGKQYKAQEGGMLRVDRLQQAEGEAIEFDTVLMTSDTGNVQVGTPYLDGVKVKATVEAHEKGKKIIVLKFKRRKGYRKKQGHRQRYTLVRIDGFEGIS